MERLNFGEELLDIVVVRDGGPVLFAGDSYPPVQFSKADTKA